MTTGLNSYEKKKDASVKVLVPAVLERDMRNGTLRVSVANGRGGDYTMYIRASQVKIPFLSRIKRFFHVSL